MTTPSALKELYIVFDFNYGFRGPSPGAELYSTTERQQIVSAFRSNGTLQKLTLFVLGDEELFTGILASLHENEMLRYLRVGKAEMDDPDVCLRAISQYLGSTDTLDQLEIYEFNLTGSDMVQLLSTLKILVVVRPIFPRRTFVRCTSILAFLPRIRLSNC